jgi:isoleucyl-tRNA synthetase
MLNTELDILAFWKEQKIFEKSISNRKNSPTFAFFDGPPFATGLPHWGHILVSQVKDTVLRYQTQKGFHVPRRWGWDCHGAPIEVLVEKDLQIRDKRQIESEIGIEVFNAKCRSKIMMYDGEWRKTIERIGRWVDMDDQYRTMDNEFIESTWWGLGQLWNKGLLYKDYRSCMYSPSVGVPLTHTDISMEVKYENETLETPVVRFATQYDSIKPLTAKILEQLESSYSEMFKLRNELQARAYNLANPGVKKATKEEILKNGFVDFDPFKWENFKTTEESTKEIISEIQPQLKVINENLEILTKIKTYLVGNIEKKFPINILAWTTTPWTLPANVALAVGEEIEYSIFFIGASSEIVIVAENLAKDVLTKNLHESITNQIKKDDYEDSGEYFGDLGVDITKLATVNGSDLIGIKYDSLFEVTQEINDEKQKENLHKVYAAEFVTLEDGTGVVHIAPGYGEDDFNLGKANNLPFLFSLNEAGEMLNDLDPILKPVYGKKFLTANAGVLDVLEQQGKVFIKFNFTHRVAVYDRDGKKVYYYAQEGWYIRETKLTARSVELNNEITWQPESLKLGRFKNGLETAPDWCISRNRYWGSPLPIWQNADKTKTVFVDSLEKLTKLAINPIFKLINDRNLNPELYENGQTVIMTDSNFKPPLGLNATQYRSKNISDIDKIKNLDIVTFNPVAQRILEEIIDLFGKYKNVQLFLDDESRKLWTTWLLTLHPTSKKINDEFYFYKAVKMGTLDWEGVGNIKILDLHRPFIDEIILRNEGSKEVEDVLTRIPEVLDCWVESGSMPHASIHYPFENKKIANSKKSFINSDGVVENDNTKELEVMQNADWICESQDQTRGWFRALHVLSTGIFNKPAFKSINCNGLIMASDGQKMSKSKNNFADPNIILEKFGADAVRIYMLSSPVVNAESLSFNERNLETTFRETTLLISNSLQYINFVYANHNRIGNTKFSHPLNVWWQACTLKFVKEFQTHMDVKNIADASRLVIPFTDNFSTWYIRRSKDILESHGDEVADCLNQSMTLFAQTVACIQPFNAEKIWSNIRKVDQAESVHLCDLPEVFELTQKQTETMETMEVLREQIGQIHSIRKSKNIRVRQPLYADLAGLQIEPNFKEIILKECNLLDKDLSKTEGETYSNETKIGTVKIDLVIDDELATMGFARDFERGIQDYRKKQGYKSNHTIMLRVAIDEVKDQSLFEKTMMIVDWDKLCVNMKWLEKLDNESDKKITVKEFVTLSVE